MVLREGACGEGEETTLRSQSSGDCVFAGTVAGLKLDARGLGLCVCVGGTHWSGI